MASEKCCSKKCHEVTVITLLIILCMGSLSAIIHSHETPQIDLTSSSSNNLFDDDYKNADTNVIITFINCILVFLTLMFVLIGINKKNHLYLVFPLLYIMLIIIGATVYFCIFTFSNEHQLNNMFKFITMDNISFIRTFVQIISAVSFGYHLTLWIIMFLLYGDYDKSVYNKENSDLSTLVKYMDV